MTLKEYEWKTDPDFFETTMPLKIWHDKTVAHKYDFNHIGIFRCDEKLDHGIYIAKCKRFEEESLSIVEARGIRKNIEKWEIIKGGVMVFIHEKAVEKMNKICPDDFQAVPAILIDELALQSQLTQEFCDMDGLFGLMNPFQVQKN